MRLDESTILEKKHQNCQWLFGYLFAPIRDATHELGTGQGRSGELWGGTRSFKQKSGFLLLYLPWEVPNPPQLGESIV